MKFHPIDLKASLPTCIAFRRDSFLESFGDLSKFSEAEYISFLERKIAADPESCAHLVHDGTIIGQVELGRVNDETGYANLFYLSREWRGRGVSSLLHDYAVSFFKRRGHSKSRLSVSETNSRALGFYMKHGWRKLEEVSGDGVFVLELTFESADSPVIVRSQT